MVRTYPRATLRTRASRGGGAQPQVVSPGSGVAPLRRKTQPRSRAGTVVSSPAFGLPSPGTDPGRALAPETPDGLVVTGLPPLAAVAFARWSLASAGDASAAASTAAA